MPLIVLCLFLPFIVFGQCHNRYSQEIFSSTQRTQDLVYGQRIHANGDTSSLLFDFYQPTGDSLNKRPLLILLHGSDFVNGSKNDSNLILLSQKLTLRGFTIATINYTKAFSLQQLLDKENLFKTSLHAAQDAKAAIRFFKKSVQQTNSYLIDTNMIWLGGIGSGSMAAQMAVYLDDSSEVDSFYRTIIQTEGGLEGSSGHPNFSSTVRGVINLSGATFDTTWMANNTEPLINIHGDLDDYYPYFSNRLFAYTHNNICNGHHELCYKRLNEVTFVQTHNSHANDNDFSVLAANQNGDVPAQFAAGVRALGLKLYYTSSIFCGSGTQLYAYHGNPFLGCIPFSTIGGQILDFLNNNPNEFLFITIEGSADNNEIAAGFTSAGLNPFLYQHTFGEAWPTLGELIASGQRLIVMTSNSGTSPSGYHHMWTFIQDTEYNFQSTNDFNCNHLRGNSDADLFLLNHFLTIGSPQPLSAPSTNDWNLVLNRARQCSANRGLHPNLLYIDFFNSGNVFRAADTLNRIGDDFPFVHGSFIVQQAANQQGLLSELYTLPNQAFAPYRYQWGDSTAAFIADFMIRHFPCALACTPPVSMIMGADSIQKDSVYVYTVDYKLGNTYQWITPNGNTPNAQAITFSSLDTTHSIALKVIETSQYGCVYDTISLPIRVFLTTAIRKINHVHKCWISPNPVQNKLEIHLDNNYSTTAYKIQIYTAQGQLVSNYQRTFINNATELEINHLSTGLYILRIQGTSTYCIPFSKL